MGNSNVRRTAIGLVLACLLPATASGQSAEQLYLHHYELGRKLQDEGHAREAVKQYRIALELAPRVKGIDRLDRLYFNLSMVLGRIGQDEEARAKMSEVEAWRRKNLGNDHPDTLNVLRWMIANNLDRRDGKALVYARERLALCERRYGVDSLEVAEALLHEALALSAANEHLEATDKHALRALAIREAKMGPKNYWLKDPLEWLAMLAMDQGEYTKAEALLNRADGLDPRDLRDGGNAFSAPSHRLARLTQRAVFYMRTGRYLEAAAIYREIFEIHKQQVAREPAQFLNGFASALILCGELHLEMGLPQEALDYYQAGLDVDEKDSQPRTRCDAFHGIARVLHQQGNLIEAGRYYQAATKARQVEAGSGFPMELKIDFATFMRDVGELDGASDLFNDLAKDVAERYSDKSPRFIRLRAEQAELALLQKDRPLAEKYFRQVIDAAGGAAGNPVTADAHLGIARLAGIAGEAKPAIAGADKARREMRRYTRRVLPALAESQQLSFLAHREARSLQQALTLALQFQADPEARAAAAGWVINAKGLAQEAIAQRTLLARGAGDPRLSAVLQEWLQVRFRLARLAVGDSAAASDKQGEREFAALTEREQALAAKLGRASATEQKDDWVELTAVRSKIPADAVLIEIVRYAPPVKQEPVLEDEKGAEKKGDEKAEKAAADPAEAPRYLAWIIPPAGPREVQMVDLGPVDALDQAVGAVRKPLLKAREEILDVGAAEAEQALEKELSALSKRLLEPLRPHLGGAKHWILSPDGSLWLIPWAALPFGKEKYLVETHVTRFLVSGRDLVEQADKPASGNASLVLADPDYDLSDKPGPEAAGGSRGSPSGAQAEDRRTRAERSAAVRSAVATGWQRLPGTAQEAKDLEPKLSAYTGSKIDLFTGRAAGEQIVRDAWQPRVAVLSTHGYFLERAPRKGATLESPLVRCGLVLAGANRRDQTAASSTDDGILTGLEIVGADFRGTELVVLSACETGLGEVRAAEGVVGLRQAFQLAGAQSVMASLWRVPDADTAELMAGFYERLAATGDKATALCEAQRALLASHRKGSQSGHPYYWAAFTLTGRADRPQVGEAKPRPERPVFRPRVRAIANAPIMDGATQVALARQGDVLEVTGEQGEWLLVPVAGRAKPGWILKRNVQAVEE